jgi:hypothetical protein
MVRLRLMLLALVALVVAAPPAMAGHLYHASLNMTEAKECPAPTALGRSATGWAILNTSTNTIQYDIQYSTPADNITGAHLHGFAGVCPATAGVRFALTESPAGSRHYVGTGSFLEADQASILAGNTYFNIHKDGNAGQVRDQFVPVATPALGPWGVTAASALVLGGGAFALSRRRRIAA